MNYLQNLHKEIILIWFILGKRRLRFLFNYIILFLRLIRMQFCYLNLVLILIRATQTNGCLREGDPATAVAQSVVGGYHQSCIEAPSGSLFCQIL